MQATQTHRLEWIQTTYKRWELKNESDGGRTVAAVDLHNARWIPKFISMDGTESEAGQPVVLRAAKSVAAQAALYERGWQAVGVAQSQSVKEIEITEPEFA